VSGTPGPIYPPAGVPAAAVHDATTKDVLREVGRLLAAGYLRLLARRDDHHHDDVRGRDPSISLDSPAQQSDELDRHQRHRRPRCKQI